MFDNLILNAQVNKLQVGWANTGYTKIKPGDMLMTGGTLKFKAESYVGYRAEGKLDLQDGAVVGSHNLTVGDDEGGFGTLLMSGGTIDLGTPDKSRNLKFGLDGAKGVGNISNGTITLTGSVEVGQKFGSIGELALFDTILNIGTSENTSPFRIGNDGGKGTGNISGDNTIVNVCGNL